MELLLTLVFGAIVGWIASMIMGSSHGILMDIVLGIVGSFIGSVVMNLLGQPGTTGFNLYSFIVSLIGAVLAIWIGRMLTRGRSAYL